MFVHLILLFLTYHPALLAEVNDIEVYAVGNFPPLIVAEGLKTSGILCERIERQLAKANLRAQCRLIPWKRAQKHIHQTPKAAIIVVKNPERLELLNFIKKPIYVNKQVIIKLAATKPAIPPAIHLVKVRGYISGFEDQLVSYKNHLEVDTLEQGLHMLQAGRGEFMLGNEISLNCIASRLKLQIEVQRVLGTSEVFLAFSKKFNHDLVNRIDAQANFSGEEISKADFDRYCH